MPRMGPIIGIGAGVANVNVNPAEGSVRLVDEVLEIGLERHIRGNWDGRARRRCR
jgi:hypothetical protein